MFFYHQKKEMKRQRDDWQRNDWQRNDWQRMDLFDCDHTQSSDFKTGIFIDGTQAEYPVYQRKQPYNAKHDSSVCSAYMQWLDNNIPEDQIRTRYAQN